jgi:uncharacterized protein
MLDALRGLAALGILLMNTVAFALYHQAYDNPTAAGGDSGANLWSWFFLHVVAEGKTRCLFSLVFGSSVILLTSRLEGHPQAADICCRRTLWLLLFGIAHSFLLWQGEILYPYALCVLVLFPLRRMGSRGLIIFAAAFMLYCSETYVAQGVIVREKAAAGKAAVAKANRGEPMTEEERDARTE